MNCPEVKNLLSQYLENDIDAKTRRLLDEHFATCQSCARELEALKKLILDLKNIPEVEPPPFYLEALHERLEKTSLLNRIAKRIFVPIHIKVPLEALAVTATALLIVILIRKTDMVRLTQPQPPAVSTQFEPADMQSQTVVGSQPYIQSQGASLKAQRMLPHEGFYQEQFDVSGLQSRSAEKVISKVYTGKSLARESLAEESYYRGIPSYAKKEAIALPSPLPEREIILKSMNLEQDISRVYAILKGLGITDIKSESRPDKVLFSFQIAHSQLEALLSRFKDWQKISPPSQEVTAKEEDLLKPLSIKLTLTTQQ